MINNKDERFLKALNFKRNGEFEKSIKLYKDIILEDNLNFKAYYAIAKVYYLLNKQKESVLNYIKSASLNLFYIKDDVFYKELYNNLINEKRLNHYPDFQDFYGDDIYLLSKWALQYSKLAPYLLFNLNLNFHLGHSLLDFDRNFQLNINKQDLEFYSLTLKGDKGDFFADSFADIYISAGYKFLVPLLNYDKLTDLNFYDDLNLDNFILLFINQEFDRI